MNNTQLAPDMPDTTDKRIRVCFVCTGNTCRSPMAAAVLNSLAPERYIAVSAGIACREGSPMSYNARLALENAGIKAPEHFSRSMNGQIARDSDIIVAISGTHFMVLLQSFPEAAGKLEAMPHDVGDPYGGDIAVYESCLALITDCIKERFI